MSISVAIVGAGPGGFYTADALLKAGADCRIDIIERLPAPFGLIRYGVSPDHETTKKVARNFERTALKDEVRYFGNVDVGRDVSVDELRARYDAVVLAVGAPFDRKLGIPGEDKKGVIGSAAVVGWYNGHPDFRGLEPDLNVESAAVIGIGNVAMDVARILVKTESELASTDITDYAAQAIAASPLTEVSLVGRRGPFQAKFSNVELREFGELETCVPRVNLDQLAGSADELEDRERRVAEKNVATLKGFAEIEPAGRAKRVRFEFFAAPREILGGDRVEALRLERTRVIDGRAEGTGEFFDLPCGLVVAAIGYRSQPLDGVPFDERNGIAINDDGRVAEGLYAVGWVKRGPTGTIATNRHDGVAAAEQIVADIADGAKPGRSALEKLLSERGIRCVGYADWQRIEAAEVAAAPEAAPRRKFVTVDEMLAVLD
jgi:ferredoxin--NADP+ reductase